jgi:hexosaminidase
MRKITLSIVMIFMCNFIFSEPLLVPEVKEYDGTGDFAEFDMDKVHIQYQSKNDGHRTFEAAETTAEDMQSKFDISATVGDAAKSGDGVLNIQIRAALTKKLDPEAYQITVNKAGILVEAWDSDGLFWGTRTVLQIIGQGVEENKIKLESCRIYDRPEFKYRGLMLDCGRHFFQIETIKFWLKYMADYKMNYFHWHLTEWNGFRFDSEVFPGLGSKEGSYSKADIKEILELAEKYHIIVVPELDIPGHSNALVEYDSKLNFQKGRFPTSYWAFNGKRTYNWHLNPTSDYTREFVRKLITEMCETFTGPYFHIGTDEYIHNPLKMAMVKDFRDYKKKKGFKEYPDIWIDFINYCNSVVKDNGKKTRLWNWWEVSFSWMRTRYSIEVDRDVEYDVWLGESAEKLGSFGVPMINCFGGATYITPGLDTQPDLNYLYGEWTPYEFEKGKLISEKYRNLVQGSKINVWADETEDKPDSFFADLMYRPLAALGAVCWQGQGGDVEKFVEAYETVK